MVHSGLQPPKLGFPKNPGRHSHMADLPVVRQTVFKPQGDGLHGSFGGSETKTITHQIFLKKLINTFNNNAAISESVSGVTNLASANWYMIGDSADGVDAASSRTWVLALVAYTRGIAGTVRIRQTFGSAAFIRIAMVFWQTFADCVVVFDATSGV